MAVEQLATVAIAAAPAAVFPFVADLERYPEWTGLVSRAVPVAVGEDGRDAWAVDLRGQVGPLARSKRLRMVRTVLDAPTTVVFERSEEDGRSHAAWTLRADVAPSAGGATVQMTFRYAGGLWGPVVERLLGDEIEQSKPRLAALVERT